MAYMHGNLAIQEKKKAEVKVRETRKVVTRRVPIPAGEKLLYLFTIVMCVAIAGMILWKYTQIYEVNTKIQQIEYKIEQLNKENSTLNVEVRRMQEPKKLIEKGKMLGLIPSDEDVVEQVSANSSYDVKTLSELAITK